MLGNIPGEHAIAALAREAGSRIALLDAQGADTVSFDQLAAQSRAMRVALAAHGIDQTAVVAYVSDTPFLSALLFLALSANAVAAPIPARAPAAEAQRHLHLLRPQALVVAGDAPDTVAAAEALEIPCLQARSDGAGGLRLAPMPGKAWQPVPGRQLDGKGLILTTSGTTGTPKLVALDQARLFASARRVAATLSLTADDTGLAIMPLHHIHGLVAGLLAPALSGGSVVLLPSPDPAGFLDAARAHRASWYTAVPTMHRAILSLAQRREDLASQCRFRVVRSSSSALPRAVREGLGAVFRCPVIEAYGMTEAAHQISAQDPFGRCDHGDVGVPEPGRVRIADAVGRALPTGETGEILIRGETVIDGYLDNPAANAAGFVDGWMRTGDIGRLTAAGELVLVSRQKELVKRGGAQIAPMEIEEALLAQPGVLEAIVFGVVHPSLGQDLAAAVVIAPGAEGDVRQLRNALFETLSEYKVPSRILQLAEIPKGPTGKPRRLEMETLLAAELHSQHPPQSPTEELLAALYEETLGGETVGRDDDFFLSGGDSLSGTSMMVQLNTLVGTAISPETLFRYPTPAELAGYVDAIDGGRVRRLVAGLSEGEQQDVADE